MKRSNITGRALAALLIAVTLSLLVGCQQQVLTPASDDSDRTVFMRDSATISPDEIPARPTGQNIYGLRAPMTADETFADSVLKMVLANGIRPSDAWFPQVMSYGCGACCIPPVLCVRLPAADARITTLGFSDSTGVTPCYFVWYHYTFMIVES
jgi:hypothetical protein